MSRSNLTPAAEACGAFVVIDFETTGMSPQQGARITEVGAVRIVNGRLTEHFQSAGAHRGVGATVHRAINRYQQRHAARRTTGG